jgi:Ca2+-binding RTX toxin-like protein
MATYTGTAASEYISTSDDDDTIFANGGADYIYGNGGNDTIYTGQGNDTAYGGVGDDIFDDYTAASFGGSDTFYGGAGNDTINGYTGYDKLYGDEGNDTLNGEGDGDVLDGGLGADLMYGGTGSDEYYADDAGDHIEEISGTSGGYDTVYAATSFTLGQFIEALYLNGRDNLNGTGNDLGNHIAGNDGSNILLGLAGNDNLYGEGGADTLEGGTGDDYLDGGAGGDSMSGGVGNDSYYLDVATDQVIEAAAAGVDTVTVSFSWTLTANLENLSIYYDAGAVNATGNAANNSIEGNYEANTLYGAVGNDALWGYGGDDSLYGGTGADTMRGDSGNDTYYVDNTSDKVTESQSGTYGGVDIVYASVTFTLGANVESLRMVAGSGAVNGTGNSLNNEIWGTSAGNTLRGLGGADTFRSGDGADVLIAGPGSDVFQFTSVIGSTPAARDVLRAGDGAVAFEKPGAMLGDRLDFLEIDADTTTAEVQDFIFGTSHAKGHLWVVNSGSNTLIRGNVDGDAAVELEIAIADGSVKAAAYTAADFLV